MFASVLPKMPESLNFPFRDSVCTLEIREEKHSQPFLKVTTSVTLKADKRKQFLKICSSLVAQEINCDDPYVMVSIEPSNPMLSTENSPSAMVELRSIGAVSPSRNQTLSHEIYSAIETYLGIPAYRVFVNFMHSSQVTMNFERRTCA